MIIDTGASQTVISRHLVDDLQLETSVPEMNNITVGIGQDALNPGFALLSNLKIQNIMIKNIPCIVLPMDHINQTYKSIGQKSIDGIIGNDLLFALHARIDMRRLHIIVETEKEIFNFDKHLQNL